MFGSSSTTRSRASGCCCVAVTSPSLVAGACESAGRRLDRAGEPGWVDGSGVLRRAARRHGEDDDADEAEDAQRRGDGEGDPAVPATSGARSTPSLDCLVSPMMPRTSEGTYRTPTQKAMPPSTSEAGDDRQDERADVVRRRRVRRVAPGVRATGRPRRVARRRGRQRPRRGRRGRGRGPAAGRPGPGGGRKGWAPRRGAEAVAAPAVGGLVVRGQRVAGVAVRGLLVRGGRGRRRAWGNGEVPSGDHDLGVARVRAAARRRPARWARRRRAAAAAGRWGRGTRRRCCSRCGSPRGRSPVVGRLSPTRLAAGRRAPREVGRVRIGG